MIFAPSLIWLCSALLFLGPAVNLVWRGGTGYCFFALVALALGAAIANRRMPGYFTALRTYRWFTIGMTAMVLAAAVQQLVMHYWLPRQFDALSRFLFALPLFLLLRQFPSRNLRAIGWGCAAGAIAVGAWAINDQINGAVTDATRLNNYYTNAIPFGDTSLLLAFLSVFTLGWDGARDWKALTFKLLALFMGGYASYLSGTRGGWLAIPVFVILLSYQYHWSAHKKRLLIAVLALTVASAAVLSTGRVTTRVEQAAADLTQMRHGDENTSVGIRLQLWHASWRVFTEHPVYGVGKGKLLATFDGFFKRGEAHIEIVNERAHSDFFSTIAEMGVIGAICLVLFYFGQTVYFWRHRRSNDPTIRAAAFSGLAVSFSTIIFGFTIDVLVPVMVTALVALLGATLLAIIDSRQRELTRAASR
ncbi:MAG TPA: O-antigen ligase family protein [Paraburkholderia sp.]|jgi:O-antigen ligase|nr:O-antigen ligase family protein [Paraburkholderia sp.]